MKSHTVIYAMSYWLFRSTLFTVRGVYKKHEYQKAMIVGGHLDSSEKTSSKLDLYHKPTQPGSTKVKTDLYGDAWRAGIFHVSWKETSWRETSPRGLKVLRSGPWNCRTCSLLTLPTRVKAWMTSHPSEISSSCVTMEHLTQMMERRGEMAPRWTEFRGERLYI